MATVLAASGLIAFGFLAQWNMGNSYAGDPSVLQSREQKGLAFINARCTICHSSDLITQQQLDLSMWTKVVDKMIKWGAPVSAEERKVLLDYLSTYHGPGEK
jgi:mono/diheme cytochrome c family protein